MADEPAVDLLDLSLVDCVRRRRHFYNDNTGQMLEQELREELEDLMTDLEQHIGDGQARLTVSGELSSSKEFHKAGAFVSISVTCNNHLDDIQAVHDIVRPHVESLVKEDHDAMSDKREEILSPPAKSPGPGKTGSPPSKRSSKVVAKKGASKKPSFRR